MIAVAEFLRKHQQRLSLAGDGDFVSAHDAFLRELASVEEAALDCLGADAEAGHRIFFSRCQRRYLAILEQAANIKMRASAGEGSPADPTLLMDDFGRASYERVRDLGSLVDLGACREIVMVGCGAFPATLFWLSRNFANAGYTGLDIDADCVEVADTLVRALGLSNVRFHRADGSRYDFGGADFVYVANQVTPKKAVVGQIVRSNPGCLIVVREPTRRGTLLSEAVRGDLPAGCVASGSGAESSRFFSYDLVVQRTATADLS